MVSLGDDQAQHLGPVAGRPLGRGPQDERGRPLPPMRRQDVDRMHHRDPVVDADKGRAAGMVADPREDRRLRAGGALHDRLARRADISIHPDVAHQLQRRPHRVDGAARQRRVDEFCDRDRPEVDRIAHQVAVRFQQRIEFFLAHPDLEQRFLPEIAHSAFGGGQIGVCHRPGLGRGRDPVAAALPLADRPGADGAARGRGPGLFANLRERRGFGENHRFGHAVASGNSRARSVIAALTAAPSWPRTTMLAPNAPSRL